MDFNNLDLDGFVDNLDFVQPPKNDPDDEPFISAPDDPGEDMGIDGKDSYENDEAINEFQNIGVSTYKGNEAKSEKTDISNEPNVDMQDVNEDIENGSLTPEDKTVENMQEKEYYRQSNATNATQETPQDYYKNNFSTTPPPVIPFVDFSGYEEQSKDIDENNGGNQGYSTGIPDKQEYQPQIPPVAAQYKKNKDIPCQNIKEPGKKRTIDRVIGFVNNIIKSEKFMKFIAVAIVTCVIILLLFIMGKISISKKYDNKVENTANTLNTQSSNMRTSSEKSKYEEDILSELIGQDNSSDAEQENIYNDTYSSATTQSTQESSRFANLDELTFYIKSKTSAVLADEKALYNQYNGGGLSSDDFKSKIQEYIDQVDGLNHLLVLNKGSYEDEGELNTYNELLDNISTLTAYGDTILYGN